ncbi:cAMP-binding domain of CRP or a regulatory subunit of cAMP-dependent protein kinases [Chitinophaga costaii]|uniref:cAMP-binding domain of CRP or a regulatory subunit of cAMP-dependent protein kinases n=1 Tax=Chitinophaga costaii TaxID=1335309 RepID=A0A1C4ENC6_9BACT|nr:Crp/Fnr family transcriptional regulator [Chitinophaga costaii]PUZ22463.1 Crp/Fnr family transcriptional regulator [Chitinophaga costaii]SCC45089.1 cAMP-binding domain of CRP or a regulatory subunit of cAMP-dependent protein kinases [Chitinophaga costaii]
MEHSFNAIDQFVSRYIALTPEETALYHTLFTFKTVKKKQFLLREGEICDFEAYILKGCIRVYYVDKEGKETVLLFAVEDWWVSDISSFMDRKPSNLYIETIEDCELLVIDFISKGILFESIPKFEKLFRILVQRNLGVLQQRFYASVSQTAEERYIHFVEKYPHILQRIPQHQVARYLGVSPEFLSKVRKGLSQKR